MSSDTPNPYQSPNFSDLPPGQTPTGFHLSPSILTQQRVVAILMIVQGSLTTIMGLFLVGVAIAMPALMSAEFNRQNRGVPPPDEFAWFVLAIYGGMGLGGLIPGILQIYAGIQNISLRGHTLGIVAISAGVLSFVTCYCIPTAAGLLVYGLIIYLHATTKLAFQLAKEGHNFDSIMQLAITNQYPIVPSQKPPNSF